MSLGFISDQKVVPRTLLLSFGTKVSIDRSSRHLPTLPFSSLLLISSQLH